MPVPKGINAAGREILFDLGIDDSTNGTLRRAQLTWSGIDKNSSDRTHWGRVKLAAYELLTSMTG